MAELNDIAASRVRALAAMAQYTYDVSFIASYNGFMCSWTITIHADDGQSAVKGAKAVFADEFKFPYDAIVFSDFQVRKH